MYRIDNSTAVTALPPPAAPGPVPNGYFTKGDPGTQLPATVVNSDWLNMVQEELMSILGAVGEDGSKTSYDQVLSALKIIFAEIGGSLTQGFQASSVFLSATSGIQPQSSGTALEVQTGPAGELVGNTFQADGRLTLGANAINGNDAVALGQGDARYATRSNVISGGSINGGTGTSLSTSVSMTPAVDTTLLVAANCGAGSAQTITNVTISASGGTLQNSAVNWSNGSTLGNALGIVKTPAGVPCTVTVSVTANASTTLSPQLVYLGVPST